jgi:hypothetical protein
MAIDREKLKKIRVFSNGVWQFQPHLHFMEEMFPDKEDFAYRVELMEIGGIMQVNDFFFRMEGIEK